MTPEEAAGFSNASLVGTYAEIAITADVGAIGICNMDGEGGYTCTSIANVPGQKKDRLVVPLTSTGTYTLTASGVGIASGVQTAPDGSTSSGSNLFAVTHASAIGHNLLATQLDSGSARKDGSADHGVLKRLPDMGNVDGGYSNASVDGVYALTAPVGPAVAGVCNMDGMGSFTCTFTAAFADEKGAMQTITIEDTGEYTVTSEGMGTVHFVQHLARRLNGRGY